MLNASAVKLSGVARRFAAYTAVENIDLEVAAGRFVSLVGPSGCGKSTVLNVIAGLIEATAGRVEIFGEPLTGLNRRAGYMFQQDALLPWKNVVDNVALGLTFRGVGAEESRTRAVDWVRRVGLQGFENSYPHQLSGGMRKRVALAQTWIVEPDIVLMDEPFSALDIHTRQRMETEVLQLWGESRKTVVFVTHDLEEAIAMSDDVLLLSAGPASRIVGAYAIDLPRPRNLIDMKTDARFADLYRTIWGDLREEVIKSHAR